MTCPVLLAEDDADLRTVMQDALQHEGYEVHTASNGRDALELLDRMHDQPVLLLDLRMPVMTGWQVLVELRRRGLNLPVIVLSAAADRRQALAAGATMFFAKPVRLQKLFEAVDRLAG